jgi:hypothetical protein
MAGLTNTTRSTMLATIFTSTAGTGHALYGSLHTADPGTTGASEVSGGSPAYARKAITWATPITTGSVSGGTITFDVPAGTYTHIGYWDAVTTGNFVGGYPLQASMTYGAQGTLPVTLTETLT